MRTRNTLVPTEAGLAALEPDAVDLEDELWHQVDESLEAATPEDRARVIERSPLLRQLLRALEANGGNMDDAVASVCSPRDQVHELAATAAKD